MGPASQPHGEIDERKESLVPAGKQAMVRWFALDVLVASAYRSVVSGLAGDYVDRRGSQAALDPDPGPPQRYGDVLDQGDLWLDFTADLGDGFDSTYSIATLLSRGHLEVGGQRLPRGRALILGGDEVYPIASREEYESRFLLPYEAALPRQPANQPDLWAIPGNHDWYDGLGSFLRLFCAQRRIGGWRTRQRRSYFAVELPHDWWLMAIDIQLDGYIDAPQIEYFAGVARAMTPGSRVILVTAKPSWLGVHEDAERPVPESYENLRYFRRKVIDPSGAQVRLTLTGDLHHFASYRAADGARLITAGGGGAYLYPTHTLKSAASVPEHDGPERTRYELEATFPAQPTSEELRHGARSMLEHAPGLSRILGVIYGLSALSVIAALEASWWWFLATIALGALVCQACVAFAAKGGKDGSRGAGLPHAGVHLLLAMAPAAAVAIFVDIGTLLAAGLVVAAVAVGVPAGGFVLGSYLAMHCTRDRRRHANEAFACQSIPDFKSFLRIRVSRDGLEVFPIGIERVPRRWAASASEQGGPAFAPVDLELDCELIEGGSMRVPREGRVEQADG